MLTEKGNIFDLVCRALGIPCRAVTNFVSAHDTNGSLSIDKFYNEDGDEIDGSSDDHPNAVLVSPSRRRVSDSIWNFHVWNEVWLRRRDLPQGFDGWQAIDATPQEQSGSIY